jgi:hypothetical protein
MWSRSRAGLAAHASAECERGSRGRMEVGVTRNEVQRNKENSEEDEKSVWRACLPSFISDALLLPSLWNDVWEYGDVMIGSGRGNHRALRSPSLVGLGGPTLGGWGHFLSFHVGCGSVVRVWKDFFGNSKHRTTPS